MIVIGAKSLVQITPNIVEVGSRSSPGVFEYKHGESSTISCVGATSVVRISPDLQYLVIENGQEININWKIEIDGVLYPDVIHTWENDESYFLHEFIEANKNQIGITSSYVNSPFANYLEIKLLSSTLVPKRIRLIPDRPFVNGMTFSDNPTISIDDDGIITFCLEHSSNNLISCEGAAQRIDFEYISGTWQFFIDDLEEIYFEGLAGHFISEVTTDYPNLHSDYDGYFWMENVDTQNHRVKMVPVDGTSYLNVTNNPTFVKHEDGSLTFCLAALE